jgi:hypothetical protein
MWLAVALMVAMLIQGTVTWVKDSRAKSASQTNLAADSKPQVDEVNEFQ